MEMICRSPPKYLAYSLLRGSPYPYPAKTAGPSASPESSISSKGERAVLYKYVHILGSPLLGMPPPSSLTYTTRRTVLKRHLLL
jgi:hypothetical protein